MLVVCTIKRLHGNDYLRLEVVTHETSLCFRFLHPKIQDGSVKKNDGVYGCVLKIHQVMSRYGESACPVRCSTICPRYPAPLLQFFSKGGEQTLGALGIRL